MGKITVRLINRHEREKYEELMERLHYLGASRSNLSKALQYVAEDSNSGEWLGLLNWGYGSLNNESRDKWIGWDKGQRDQRLKFVLTNTRFLLLPTTKRYRHLASQILSKVVKRLSSDWSLYHGHHVLVAETFVDKKKFKGTCYKAANWQEVGETKGFARNNKSYIQHDEIKKVFVYPLYKYSRQILSSKGFPNKLIMTRQEQEKQTVDLNKLPLEGRGGLIEALGQVEDGRSKKGIRYSLKSILALTVCALLTGIDSFRGINEFGEGLTIEIRKKLGFRIRGIVPDEETLRLALNKVDALKFDKVAREWIQKQLPSFKGCAIAIDGKTMRACRTGEGDKAPHILSAVLHHDGTAIATSLVADKTNEIPVARQLIKQLPVKGAVITLDAMHTQKETADTIVAEKNAHYLMTVKENQSLLLDKLQRLPQGAFSPCLHNKR